MKDENEKKKFNELIQKYSANLSENISKIFEEANKPTANVKEQKIDWLNKQVEELSEYKKKGIDYDNKIKELTEENQLLINKNKIRDEHLDFLKKNLVLKDEAINSIKERKTHLTLYLNEEPNNLDNISSENSDDERNKKIKTQIFPSSKNSSPKQKSQIKISKNSLDSEIISSFNQDKNAYHKH